MSSPSPFLQSLGPGSLTIDAVPIQGRLESLSLSEVPIDPRCESVHLLDDEENLLIGSEKDFITRLKIDPTHKVKVVSIFGNTGEGKSYTLNHTFFNGKEIFKTSPYQNSCTIGVWAKYDPTLRMICIDTEGFLGGASKAYKEHFSPALQNVLQKYDVEKSAAAWGPSVIIFHETRYASTLNSISDVKKSPEDIVRENFATLDESCDGFSSLKYIGFRNSSGGSTSFKELKVAVEKELESSHKCYNDGTKQVVEPSYQAKNEQFWSSIISTVWSGYVIECPKCGKIYQSREYWYGNKDPKDEAVVIDIVHVWPGQKSLLGSQNSAQKVLDGVTSISNVVASVGSQPTKMISDWVTDQIAPSYWKPNNEIVECNKCKIALSNATKHHCRACGEGFCEACSSKTQPVPSRGWYENVRVCDDCYTEEPISMSHLADVVKSILDKPKEMIKDTARPSYWTPDNECLHHCRDCGKGVCDKCSTTRKPVEIRGWETPVRVCDLCSS
ncbi:FYVE domain containing protein [Asbolus verrucosus]|uniref:FYVE domain containing protein n=1 Tax=Asbolus verrucosus TaxID=1661398 RepID=A0A482W799_ASBVE|nr:FYVE domain containing protein [Asbolus verrucosus]